ncbi:Sialic acid-specific 9-O-acetylesterase [Rhodopirellula islandica]|uniref:Sialic acid-specific 9-O-acetylesterase n=1 Tax=Rhodopirellula islandica TaxID=595434 RepID=A0A0J1B6C4_RHOIS|nr:sialate O-acetylesterase [Rhodopirellula islandica]KLU02143.1 Sialic acid-specific 9-O-acetylesterase [Rhodopirellula islandica]
MSDPRFRFHRVLFAALFLCSSVGALHPSLVRGDVKLPGFFSDHMVLQQEKPIRVWGWAEPSEKVQVTIGDDQASTQADAEGHWVVELPSRSASADPVEIKVTGNNEIELQDILIGEVWLCSGQSNMEWRVQSSVNAAEEIAAANFPQIRHMKVPRVPSPFAQDDVLAPWQVCSPETAGQFTAAGYFMARRLHQELNVPIGLVNSSWGGTRIEPWTPPVGFQGIKELKEISDSVTQRTPGTDAYESALQNHLKSTKAWIAKAEQALANDSFLEPAPEYPSSLAPFTSHGQPTTLYNGMIHPLIQMPIRGAIWYQGEANRGDGMLYKAKMQALIEGWRAKWNQGPFPFYFVQIAPYQYGDEAGPVLAKFWEAQTASQTIPNTAMVVTNDIATLDNIHPPNKQDVGKRLADLALRHDYGKTDLVAHSPELESMQPEGSQLRLRFKNVGGDLKTSDDQSPNWFEIIGPNSGGFQTATAKIEGNEIVLSSPKVQHPVAMRFAWDKLAEPNLRGATGLPVSAFRAGKVPSFAQTIPGADDYELVYELDLNKLGASIQYDIDRHADIFKFDRVAYLVSLEDASGNIKSVFVSMDAFTDDIEKLAIPTVESKATFQQAVESMNVHCSDASVSNGTGVSTGRIEFWPNNYSPSNDAKVPGASGTAFDFGDQPGPPADGYGCMQVHNVGARETVFALNNWKRGRDADLGIGNHSGEHTDWTFASNAAQYDNKKLQVLVRPVK